MKLSKPVVSILAFPLLSLIFLVPAFGQTDLKPTAEPNFEAILHVVAGTSETGQDQKLPQSLSSVSKQLQNDFGVTNLKLLNTYIGRLANTGSLDYRGVSSAYAQEPASVAPSFLDWKLTGLRIMQNAAGQNVFQFQSFKFGARVPIRVAAFRDESSKSQSVVNYESIGLTLDRMSVAENSATLVGTLSQPKTDGTLFLILIVKGVGK